MLNEQEKRAVMEVYKFYDDVATLEEVCDCLGIVRNVKYLDEWANEINDSFIVCLGDGGEIRALVVSVSTLLFGFETSPQFHACNESHEIYVINYEEVI